MTGGSARLIADGRLRTVSITSLIGATEPAADVESEDGSGHLWVIPSVVLSGLTTKQADALTAKLHTLRQVIEPEPDDARTLTQRYDDAATARGQSTRPPLGVSRRTLERQVARLVELGPAGVQRLSPALRVLRAEGRGTRALGLLARTGTRKGECGGPAAVRSMTLRRRSY